MQDMLVIDVETTGIDPLKNSIISVGGIIIPKNLGDTILNFYNETIIWPGAEISETALEYNGATREEITSNLVRLKQSEMLENLIHFVKHSEDQTVWGHNPRFDVDFLNASFEREGFDFRFSYHTLDQHTLVYAHLLQRGIIPPLKNERSAIGGDTVSEYVGVPKEPRPHNGLNGAKWEAEAIYRLVYGKNFHPSFKKYPVPTYLKRD